MIFSYQRKKKMSILQNSTNRNNVNSYLPAILKENKSGWVIEYYVIHPQTEVLTRKQIRLSRIVSRYKKISDARKHISTMMIKINNQLADGWNPFFENEDARMFEKLNVVARLFVENRRKELRKNTIRSYESFVNNFLLWVDKNCPEIYASTFSQSQAIRYMDDLFAKNSVGVTTYNNNIKMARALFNWLKERCYTKQNPFDLLKLKPKTKKERILIPVDVRTQLNEHLKTNNPHFLLILHLVYNCLIRPNEINQLQVKHLFLNEKFIKIPAEIAKNHKTRQSAITPEIFALFQQINIDNFPLDYYLFSGDLKPGKVPSGPLRYGKEWSKLRTKLKLPKEMQLYSLRDTGIFDMLKSGIDDLSVMQHADHSSLDITTIYANHHDPNLINKIYSRAPKF